MRFLGFLVELIIYFILIFSPIPFGSVEELWRFLISAAISLGGIVLISQRIFRPSLGFVLPEGYIIFVSALLLTFLSSVFSPLPQQAIRSTIFFSTISLFPLIVINQFNSKTKLWPLLLVLSGVALSLCLYGLIKVFSHSSVPDEQYRLHFTSTYYNHNHFAGFIEMILPFLATQIFVFSIRKRAFFLFLPLFIFFFGMLLLTFSRGGLIGFLLGFTTIMYVFSKKIKSIYPLALVMVVIIYLSFSLKDPLEKIFSTESVTLSGHARFLIVKSSLLSTMEHPFTGWGAGNFEFAYFKFRNGIDGIVNYAHNDYIQAIVELGIPLGIFFIFFLTRLYISSIREVKNRKDHFYYYLGISSGAGILSIAFHEFVDFNLRIPANAVYFSLLFGLLILSTFSDRKSRNIHLPVEVMPTKEIRTNVYKVTLLIITISLFLSSTKIFFNEIKYRKALKLYDKGNFLKSGYILKEVKDSMLSRPDYFALYCRALSSEAFITNSYNMLEKAINSCKEAIKSNPYNPLYVLDTADLLKKAGHINEALNYYKIAMEMDPENLYLKSFYFEVLIQSGKMNEGMNLFESVMQSAPQKAGILLDTIKKDRKLLMDFMSHHLENKSEDIEIFLNYLANNWFMEEYHKIFNKFYSNGLNFTAQRFYNIAGNYLFYTKPGEAEQILRDGIKIYPELYEGYQLLMSLLFTFKKYDDLLKLTEEVERRFNSTDAYYYKAMVFNEKNELFLALRYAKLCLARNVNNNNYRILLYNIYMKMGMEFEALQALGNSSNFNAEDVNLLYLKAELLEKWGKYEDAIRDYKRILDFQNNTGVVKKIIELEEKRNAKIE